MPIVIIYYVKDEEEKQTDSSVRILFLEKIILTHTSGGAHCTIDAFNPSSSEIHYIFIHAENFKPFL